MLGRPIQDYKIGKYVEEYSLEKNELSIKDE